MFLRRRAKEKRLKEADVERYKPFLQRPYLPLGYTPGNPQFNIAAAAAAQLAANQAANSLTSQQAGTHLLQFPQPPPQAGQQPTNNQQTTLNSIGSITTNGLNDALLARSDENGSEYLKHLSKLQSHFGFNNAAVAAALNQQLQDPAQQPPNNQTVKGETAQSPNSDRQTPERRSTSPKSNRQSSSANSRVESSKLAKPQPVRHMNSISNLSNIQPTNLTATTKLC